LTITEFHENRMSVDPIVVGAGDAVPALAAPPAREGTR